MKVTSHILFWLGLILIMSVVVPTLMGPVASRARIQDEHDAAVRVFGPESADRMTEEANTAHGLLIVKSGIQKFIDHGFTSEAQLRREVINPAGQTKAAIFFNRYMQTVSTELYGLVFRGIIMMHWMLYIGLFLLAAIVDGVCQRRVKLATAGTLSPLRFTIAMHLFVAIAFSPIVYLLAPIAVTPWFMVGWVLVIAYPLAKAISNIVGLD
jgi:hypothetical protein